MKTILVADDEFDISEAICAILTADGFQVAAVSNGKEAIKYLSENQKHVDLVILDIMMPFVSGYEVLRFIRNENRLKDIPVILMSAAAPAAKQVDFKWNEFLKKPFELDRFESVVAKYLSK